MNETIKLIRENRKRERIPNPNKYNDRIRNSWLSFWARNARRNGPVLEAAFEADPLPEAALQVKPVRTKECIVIGSGPSLDKHKDAILAWEGDVWCSSSHLAWLQSIGRTPDYCVIIDADPTMTFLVENVDTTNITLITHPCMERDVVDAWDGPILWFRMQDPGDPFFSEYLPLMYSGLNAKGDSLKTFVMNSGCVVNTAVAIAMRSYETIFLMGVDGGYPGNQYRFTNIVDGVAEQAGPPPEERKVFLATGDVWTDTVNVFYKYSLYVLWGIDGPNIISCDYGIFRELPWMSSESVIEGAPRPKLEQDDKYLIAREYLRYRGIFIIKRKMQRVKIKVKYQTFRKLRKFVTRFTVWQQKRKNKVKGKSRDWPQRHGIQRSLLKSDTIRVKVGKIAFALEPGEVRIGFDGYVRIQNMSALPWYRRPLFMAKYWIGRTLGAW